MGLFDGMMGGAQAGGQSGGGWGAAAGAIIGGAAGMYDARSAIGATSASVNDMETYNTQMANTQWQRAVADMKAAGLNPALAYTQGPNAAPTGTAFKMGGRLGNAVSSASEAASTVAGVQNTEADTRVKEAQKILTDANTTHHLASAGQLDAQKDQIRQEMTAFAARLERMNWEATAAKLHAGILNSEDLASARYYAARAEELQNRARVVGLDIPEALATAAFYSTDFGKNYPAMKAGAGLASSAMDVGGKIQGRKSMGGAKGLTVHNYYGKE